MVVETLEKESCTLEKGKVYTLEELHNLGFNNHTLFGDKIIYVFGREGGNEIGCNVCEGGYRFHDIHPVCVTQ